MTTTGDTVERKIELSSLPSNIIYVEAFIDEFRCLYHINDETYGNMLVCITEAVNNAIIHGNSSDGSKRVFVHLKKARNTIACIVEDEGIGFDFTDIPDPTAPENIENAGGRGIFLMKHLSDMVIFSNDGSNVEIQFKI